MSTPTPTQRLEEIHTKREALDKEIKLREKRIRKAYDAIFTPDPTPAGRISTLVANAGKIAAVADGVLFGYRILRQIRRYTK